MQRLGADGGNFTSIERFETTHGFGIPRRVDIVVFLRAIERLEQLQRQLGALIRRQQGSLGAQAFKFGRHFRRIAEASCSRLPISYAPAFAPISAHFCVDGLPLPFDPNRASVFSRATS